jgi:hypothetical protein
VSSQNVTFPDFREAIWTWYGDALKVLARSPRRRVYPVLSYTVPTQAGSIQYSTDTSVNPLLNVVMSREALVELEATNALVQLVADDAEIGRLLTELAGRNRMGEGSADHWADTSKHDGHRTALVSRLQPILIEHEADADYVPDAERFSRLYEQLETAMLNPETTEVTWICQYWNLETIADPIAIAPGVTLRAATEDEWQTTTWSFDFSSGVSPEDIDYYMVGDRYTLGTVLELRATLSDFGETPAKSIHEWASRCKEAVLLGLRLLQPQKVAFRLAPVRTNNVFVDEVGRLDGGLMHWARWTFEDPYIIGKETRSELRLQFPQLVKAVTESELTVPKQRFADSYFRGSRSDQLIDYWVALESMFLFPSDRRDLTETTKHAVAFYLGKDQEDRLRLWKDVGTSYHLRSFAVHGERPNDPNERPETTIARRESLGAAAQQAGDWVRSALIKRIAEL